MEESKKSEVHLTSPAAFVEGGIQEAFDDACSICLEVFCDSDPSTVTSCKHEFHLQCILEWCQRSSQCPMCWQPISLKDPTSQELLEGVERERSFRFNPSRNAAIFHHPTLGDFELQHLPVGANDADLEERIIQHLAAAAAMGRARHIARRGGHRNRLSAQGRSQYLVASTHPNSPPASPAQRCEEETAPAPASGPAPAPSSPHRAEGEVSSQLTTSLSFLEAGTSLASAPGSSVHSTYPYGSLNSRKSPSQSSPNNQDRAGPSEFPSFSDSLKSRLNEVSIRYKDSISKTTRGWREKLFSRDTSMADLGSEVKREVNAGIATISRMMERLETRNSSRINSSSNSLGDSSASESNNKGLSEGGGNSPLRKTSKQGSRCEGSSSSN